MQRAVFAMLASLAVMALGTSAMACTKPGASRAALAPVPAQSRKIDQRLFNRALLEQVNYHRCQKGLRPLRANGSLTKAATGHSQWMAGARNLTHRSTKAGYQTMSQRVERTFGRYGRASENIGTVHRYYLDTGARFMIRDAGACHFEIGGKRVPAHNYHSLAGWMAHLWMNSPGHRKNILDRKVTHMGSAVGYDPRHPNCGAFWITQNFATPR